MGQFNVWPKRAAAELTAIGRVQDAVIKRHLRWLNEHERRFDCTVWEMCGCTTVMFVAHLEREFADGLTWQNFGQWHVDHFFPLDGVDPDNAAAIFGAFHFTNLRPLARLHNLQKSSRVQSALVPRATLRRYSAPDTFTELPLASIILRRGNPDALPFGV